MDNVWIAIGMRNTFKTCVAEAICSRTIAAIRALFRPIALAGLFTLSIAAAQNPPLPSGAYRIAGTVVSSKGGAHLAKARVFVTDVKNRTKVESHLTDDVGHFDFHVPAGKFALRGAKRGYIPAAYDQHEQFSTAIVTGAGLDTENLVLQLAPTAVLIGRVVDENGDPVRQANVTLWREDHSSGLSRTLRFRNEVADDRGSYEFAPLDAGTYFLSVSARPWYAVNPPSVLPENSETFPTMVDRSLDVIYPITYYAGATESEDATPIPLRGGDRQELELRLLPVPAVHVTFRAGPKDCAQTDGQCGNPPMFRKRVFDEIENYQTYNTQMIVPGLYEMALAPGKYSLQVNNSHGTQISDVDVSQEHRELETSSGEATSNVSVSVHLLDGTPLPSPLSLGLVDHLDQPVAFQQVGSQGEAQFAEVSPGSYEFSVGSPNKAYSVVRTASQGHTTSGSAFKVTAGTPLSLDVYVAGENFRVEGVALREGKPAAGAMVVLMPKHPDSDRGLFRRDQSDLDGTFTLQAVVPGTYTVLAIADGWDLDWSQPAVIERYAAHGQTIVIPATGDHRLKLSAPVEVQRKVLKTGPATSVIVDTPFPTAGAPPWSFLFFGKD